MNRQIFGILGVLALCALATASRLGAQNQDGRASYALYNLGTLGGSVSSGNTINDLGWVIGNANLPGDEITHAAVWIDGMKFDLGTLGGANSVVEWPVHNERGVISGFAETADIDSLMENWSCSAFFPSVTHHVCLGFRYFEGTMTRLPTLGGTNGYAAGVNNWGEIVGWAENTVHDSTCHAPQVLQFEAVAWSPNNEIRALPPYPGDVDGAATAVNDDGDVVGISGTCDNAVGAATAAHALIWRRGQPIADPDLRRQGLEHADRHQQPRASRGLCGHPRRRRQRRAHAVSVALRLHLERGNGDTENSPAAGRHVHHRVRHQRSGPGGRTIVRRAGGLARVHLAGRQNLRSQRLDPGGVAALSGVRRRNQQPRGDHGWRLRAGRWRLPRERRGHARHSWRCRIFTGARGRAGVR